MEAAMKRTILALSLSSWASAKGTDANYEQLFPGWMRISTALMKTAPLRDLHVCWALRWGLSSLMRSSRTFGGGGGGGAAGPWWTLSSCSNWKGFCEPLSGNISSRQRAARPPMRIVHWNKQKLPFTSTIKQHLPLFISLQFQKSRIFRYILVKSVVCDSNVTDVSSYHPDTISQL